MTDCLLIGFNDSDFSNYVEMVKSMGTDSGAFRDLNLAYIDYLGSPRRSMDLLNLFRFDLNSGHPLLHNADFLWPVITYLSTYLHRRGLSYDYINLFHLQKESLKEKLLHDEILTIAVTTTLYVSAHPLLEIIAFIREHNQKARIIVGGPFISNQPRMSDDDSLQRLFKYIGADVYVISQEGEQTLVDVINCLKSGDSLSKVANLAFREGDNYVRTETLIESNPLEENMVDYSLFGKDEINEFVTLRTAKSCPFSCAFCGFPQRAGKYKYLSVEMVEQELNAIREIGGVTTLTFIDDTFNVPKERFRQMLKMMIRNKYGFKWNSFYRSDHGDAETIELMGAAGCEGVFLGVESGSDRMLERMNKTARRKNYLEAIPQMREAGISTHANLIVGFPGESYETVEESQELIEETRPDFYRAQLWYADPVTPIWERREEYGVKGSSFSWSHETMDYMEACELIEKMFLSLEGSVWLPQNGFEQWSVFYLQRKGMGMEEIKRFLRSFNATIKEKLLEPGKEEIDEKLMERVRRSSRGGEEEEMREEEELSGRRYKEAEAYWVREMGEEESRSRLGMVIEGEARGEEMRGRKEIKIEVEEIEEIGREIGASGRAVILGAYSLMLMRVSGEREQVIVVGRKEGGKKEVKPIKVRGEWGEGFGEYVREIERKEREGEEHKRYGMGIVSNELRMREHGKKRGKLEVGYEYEEGDEGGEGGGMIEEAKRRNKEVREEMRIEMGVRREGRWMKMELRYREGEIGEERAEKMIRYVEKIIRGVKGREEEKLGEIELEREIGEERAGISVDMSETFNFF